MSVILFIILLLIIIFILFFILKWYPCQQRKKRMIDLGYKQAESLESDILIRMNRLFPQKLNEKNIFRLSGEGAHFFVVFLKPPGAYVKNDPGAMVVYSKKLDLPGLKLSSKMKSARRLDSLMNNALDQIAELEAPEKNLTVIKFPHLPDFNDRFVLLARDEKTVMQYFVPDRTQELLQIQNQFELWGAGNLFTLKLSFSRSDLSMEDKIRKSIGLAKKIYRIFKD